MMQESVVYNLVNFRLNATIPDDFFRTDPNTEVGMFVFVSCYVADYTVILLHIFNVFNIGCGFSFLFVSVSIKSSNVIYI
jgi:hypothetical protein